MCLASQIHSDIFRLAVRDERGRFTAKKTLQKGGLKVHEEGVIKEAGFSCMANEK